MIGSLGKIIEGPQSLVNGLLEKSEINEYEIGALLLLDFNSLKNPVIFFEVLWRTTKSHLDVKDFMFKKIVFSFLSYLRKEKQKVIRENLGFIIESLGKIAENYLSYSLSDRSAIQDKIVEIYKETKFNFKETKDLIKIIRIGKVNKDVYFEVNDEIITIEEIDFLISIYDSPDFVQGTLQLFSLCQKVLPKRTQFLYDFAVTTIIYLIDNKAQLPHFDQICQFFLNYSKNLNKSKRLNVLKSFKSFCFRIQADQDVKLKELKQKVLYNLDPNLEREGVAQNPVKNSDEANDAQKNQEKQKGRQKKAENKPKFPQEKQKNSEEQKKAENKPKFPQEKQKNSEEQKKAENKEPGNLEVSKQIADIILEAEYLFEQGQRIEVGSYFEKFMEIDYKNYSLFQKIDEMMAKDRPSEKNAKFWSIMLKVFEKLPQLDNYQISGLRDKHNKLKGKVRDNKEKPCKNKQRKEEYKENLKKTGKFVEGFKNGDREQKRSQKSMLDTEYQEFLQYSHSLTEELNTYLEDISFSQGNLMKVDSAIREIIAKLKKASKTVFVKVIGSAATGCYLKEGSIDLLVQDKSQQVIEYLQEYLEGKYLNSDLFECEHLGYVFHLYLKNEFQSETAALFKKYCEIDNRTTKLIIFAKLWARKAEAKISGFQLSLIAIGFLQTVNPPVLLSLQTQEHEQKLINEMDVGFSQTLTPSSNLWTFGELVYHFFHFYSGEKAFKINIKKAEVTENGTEMLILHPFTETSVGPSLDNSAFRYSVSSALSKLNSFSPLQTILS